MGLLSVLQSAVHSAKQIPAAINQATHEDDPEFTSERIPSIIYDGQITPDGPNHHMDLGGGISDQPPTETHHVSDRPNTFGRVLNAVPGILKAGIAGAARPNIAGGGATDVLRSADGGIQNWDEQQAAQQQRARQKEQDAYRRQVQQSQIEENQALAEERRAKAAQPVKPPATAQAVGPYGYMLNGVFHPAPEKTDPKAETAAEARNFRIANAGGYELPESRTDQISIDPTNSVIGPLGPRKVNIQVPPPEGYHALPGTSGEDRIVMPSAETKGDLRHPDKPTPVHYIQGKDGTTTAVRLDADGNLEEVPIEAKGMGQKPTNPRATVAKKSVTDQVSERTKIADQQGMTGDKREQYILNGRISAAKKGGMDLSPEGIAAMFGGDAPAANPRATPAPDQKNGQKVIAMPPEKAAALPVGQQKGVNGPDGKLWIVIKGTDGLVRRLR